jgi:ATP adenylyltransferase
MNFEEIKQYITKDMSMSHVYQPLMLIELLKNYGTATEEEIATVILNRDPTQLDYYIDKVKNMVGKVLNKNGITTKIKNKHSLNGFYDLSEEQVDELINLCRDKLIQYEDKRGGKIWEHRATDREAISGSVRYKVLLRAGRRCESCGVSVDVKPIDVDHIVPRSLGGKNDVSNYQALCWECNTNKGNKDNTNFSELEKLYAHRQEDCLFCNIQSSDKQRIVDENTLAYVIRDGFAVTEYHSLFIPKRHVLDYFSLTQAEVNAINNLIQIQKNYLDKIDKTIEGYNIGMNCGKTAGQSVWHCHVHLIPRRYGDVENPKGGVRNVIPGKGNYDEKYK